MEENQENQDQQNKVIEKKVIKEVINSFDEKPEAPETKTLVIRHDNPKKVFDYERQKVSFTGVIDAPLRYIEKRTGLFNPKESSLLVDREKMTLQLLTNERDHFQEKIKGALQVHPDFEAFGINQPLSHKPQTLGRFLKMNRSVFDNIGEAMALVNSMMKFEANVNKVIADQVSNTGDRKLLMEQTVESNLPPEFYITIGIFKGQPSKRILVEIVIDPSDLKCGLESAEAAEYMDYIKNTVIDEQIRDIKILEPDLLIIEQ